MLKCSKCLHRLCKSWGRSNLFGCNLNALYAHHCSPISPLQTSQRRSKEHFQRLQDRWLRCQHTWSRIQSRARSPQWILPGNPKVVRFIVFSTSFYLRHLPVYPIRWISNSKYHMAMLAGCFLKLPTMAEFDVEKTWEKKTMHCMTPGLAEPWDRDSHVSFEVLWTRKWPGSAQQKDKCMNDWNMLIKICI